MALLPHNSTVTAVQQKSAAEVRAELQAAAREIRDQIRQELQQGRGGRGQPPAGRGPPPAPPDVQRIIVETPGGAASGEAIVSVPPIPFDPNAGIPPQAVDISIAFFLTIAAIIIGLPISRAFARRMDRKATPSEIPREVSSQLQQLAQSVDAIALEVERISEGQRFTTRLLSEQRDATRHALPAGPER